MGQVVGNSNVKEPSFKVLYTSSYEIREYSPYYVAEILTKDESDGFKILANYIGVFGKAQNKQKESIAMTAPVITYNDQQENPILIQQKKNSEIKMCFVLPEEYTLDNSKKIPEPTDPQIQIKLIPKQIVAVDKFSGTCDMNVARQHETQLLNQLIKDKIIDSNQTIDTIESKKAIYNPPFTLPAYRRNEVWIKLDEQKLENFLVKN